MKKSLMLFIIATCTIASINPGGKLKEDSDCATPHYIELGPDLGIYHGVVTDGTQKYCCYQNLICWRNNN